MSLRLALGICFLAGIASAQSKTSKTMSRTSKRIVTGDPVSSLTSQGISSLATPLPDQFSANIAATADGAKATVNVMPLGFVNKYFPVLSEMRVELYGNADSQPEYGGAFSIGYNSASAALSRNADNFSPDEIKELQKCAKAADGELNTVYALLVRDQALQMINSLRHNDAWGASECGRVVHCLGGDAGGACLDEWEAVLRAAPDGGTEAKADGGVELDGWVNDIVETAGYLSINGSCLADNGGIRPGFEREAPLAKAIGELWAKLVKDQNASLDEGGDCVEKLYSQKRLRDAYANAGAVYVKGTVHLFPGGAGPTFAAEDGSTTNPFANALSLAAIGVSGAYWHTWGSGWHFRVLPSVSFAWNGSGPTQTALVKKLAAGLDFALSHEFGDPDEDGFQPSYGFGLNSGIEKCLEVGGCLAKDIPNYSDAKNLKTDLLVSAGAYGFLRVSEKLQFQVTIPVNTHLLSTAIDSTSTRKTIVEVVPTLSASVSLWTLGQTGK